MFLVNVPGGFYQLWFAVRYVHLVAGAALIGGAALLSIVFVSDNPSIPADAAAGAALTYEWLFWAVAAVSVVTGFSNLGLKGDGLLPAETQWGTALSVKLSASLVLLALGIVRTDTVVTCVSFGDCLVARAWRRLGWLYAATLTALLTMLWLGLGLAHGRY